ncbi:MAG: DUF3387 domain-containing protein [Desulfovibrio sp.]|nr:DUF3387 domain-containing protein [Desulfovibrio sp.]
MCQDILKHYEETRQFELTGKAMIVVYSRAIAIRIYRSQGIINLFPNVDKGFFLFDPKFLEEISKMKERNLAVELLKKLIAEQVFLYRRTNLVKSEKFSDILSVI